LISVAIGLLQKCSIVQLEPALDRHDDTIELGLYVSRIPVRRYQRYETRRSQRMRGEYRRVSLTTCVWETLHCTGRRKGTWNKWFKGRSQHITTELILRCFVPKMIFWIASYDASARNSNTTKQGRRQGVGLLGAVPPPIHQPQKF